MLNSGISKVYNTLSSGEMLTAKQIRSRYNLANPHDAVYALRQEGFPIALFRDTDSSGRVTRKYMMVSTIPSASTYTVKAATV